MRAIVLDGGGLCKYYLYVRWVVNGWREVMTDPSIPVGMVG